MPDTSTITPGEAAATDAGADAKPERARKDRAKDERTVGERVREELRFFGGLMAVMLFLFTFVFGHFKIPSESMQPTLEVGDHLYASKHAYGYSRHSLPFGLHNLTDSEFHWFSRVPERGDVAVFRHPRSGLVMIKRVVGLPGDTIETVNGRLVVNGTVLARDAQAQHRYREFAKPRSAGLVADVTEYSEQFPGEDGPHRIFERGDAMPLDNRGPWAVPEGTVFMVGDNRDNSVDSRAPTGPGFVPLDHLIGRAELMMFSFNRCKAEDGLRCPGSRWFRRL